MRFKLWLLEFANYGFDKKYQDQELKNKDTGDKPIPSHRVDYIVNQLRKVGVGEFKGEYDTSSVWWGNGFGSIIFIISPFGRFTGTFRLQSKDSEGRVTWLCKKVLILRDFESPDEIIDEATNIAREINKEEIPGPKKGYKDLQKLSIEIVKAVNKYSHKKIFRYNGIKVVKKDEHYIITYNCTGQGVQRQGQKRLDQFQIDVRLENDLIKINGNELGDVLGKHRWIYDPSEFIEWFSPTQEIKDIAEAISLYIKAY